MRVLNKIVIILMLLVLMILIPAILIFPEQAEFVLRYAADVIQANLGWIQGLSPTAQIAVRLLLALAGLIVFLVGLLLIFLELFRSRRKTVRLKDRSGELMVDSIAGHLTYHIDLLPDVLRVQPVVASSGNKLRATLYVETPPDVHVPQKSAEIKETARKVIEEQLGLQTRGEIKVIVRPTAYPKISPVEQKRVTRADRPIAAPLPPVEALIEEEEKRAEPLYPEKEELPYPIESPIAPAETAEGQEQEEPEPTYPFWEDAPPDADQGVQDDEKEDSTTLDVKKPPSESLG
jgi:hypothetical protein